MADDLHYTAPDGEPWRCSRLDLLAAELEELLPAQLPEFHAVACRSPRTWLIVRRLFGMRPVLPPPDSSPDDLRVWSRKEICAALGVTNAQLNKELTGVRAAWRVRLEKAPALQAAAAPAPPAVAPETPPGELQLVDVAKELAKLGFPKSIFEQAGIAEDEIRAEMEWFYGRCVEWQKLLSHPMGGQLSSQALVVELHMRRLTAALGRFKVGDSDYHETLASLDKLRTQHGAMLKRIDEFDPWMAKERQQQGLVHTMTGIVEGFQRHYADPANVPVDGVFSGLELQVLVRTNNHSPVRYRAGLSLYLNMARERLFDPQFRDEVGPKTWRKLDAVGRAVIEAVMKETAEPVIEVEGNKPEDEYPPLEVPATGSQPAGKGGG